MKRFYRHKQALLIAAACLWLSAGCAKKPGTEPVPETVTPLSVTTVPLSETSDTLTDKRDGQKYRVVKIGNQVWMARNLNYRPPTGKSRCYLDDTPNCDKYGRLYNWGTAKEVCPSGWHLPTRLEWDILCRSVGGIRKSYTNYGVVHIYWEVAGDKLKAASAGLKTTDDYGFSAIPGGTVDCGGRCNDLYYGGWWTATDGDARYDTNYAYIRSMTHFSDDVHDSYDNKGSGSSVRCVSDATAIPSSHPATASTHDTLSVAEDILPPAPVKRKTLSVKRGMFTDERDGKAYRTVTIDKRTWMAENLNYQTDSSWCYGNADSNCVKYGRLYNGYAARTACPDGWHLSSGLDWDTLFAIDSGLPLAPRLKSKKGWNEYRGNGTDDYGFSALPGGFRCMAPPGGFYSSGCSNGSFYNAGEHGYWWTAREYDADLAYYRGITGGNAMYGKGYFKSNAYSVRCVNDDY